jgi:hypothetical protein
MFMASFNTRPSTAIECCSRKWMPATKTGKPASTATKQAGAERAKLAAERAQLEELQPETARTFSIEFGNRSAGNRLAERTRKNTCRKKTRL